MNNKTNPRKNNKLKIVIPIIVVVLILGIWIIKNNNETTAENLNLTQQDSSDSASSQTNEDPSEFALNVTSDLDMKQLKSYGLPIIIDFGADSCIPCKEMAPVLKELNESLQGKAIIKFVDVRKYPDLYKNFPLKVIPTQFFFDKDGNPYSPSDAESVQLDKYTNKDTNEHTFTMHEGGVTKEQLLSILKEMGVDCDEVSGSLSTTDTKENVGTDNNNSPHCSCSGY